MFEDFEVTLDPNLERAVLPILNILRQIDEQLLADGVGYSEVKDLTLQKLQQNSTESQEHEILLNALLNANEGEKKYFSVFNRIV